MTHHLLLAGCGYTGERLAAQLTEANHTFLCVTHSDTRRDRLRAAGYNAVADDLGVPSAQLRPAVDTIVYLAPPPPEGERDTTLEGFLAAIERPRRFVYLSTSGVYGDCGGALVDETRPPAPRTARAIRRLAAETALTAWAAENGVEAVILRVPGIYGPGRLPLERIRRADPVLRAKDSPPGNRIHVTDLATACSCAAIADNPPAIVNIGDGDHMSSTAFTCLVATLSGRPKPPAISREEAEQTFSRIRWSFLAESRRLDTTRMRHELGVKLRYANPADGIRQALQFEP